MWSNPLGNMDSWPMGKTPPWVDSRDTEGGSGRCNALWCDVMREQWEDSMTRRTWEAQQWSGAPGAMGESASQKEQNTLTENTDTFKHLFKSITVSLCHLSYILWAFRRSEPIHRNYFPQNQTKKRLTKCNLKLEAWSFTEHSWRKKKKKTYLRCYTHQLCPLV